jgi:hypothetical protein
MVCMSPLRDANLRGEIHPQGSEIQGSFHIMLSSTFSIVSSHTQKDLPTMMQNPLDDVSYKSISVDERVIPV